MINTTILRIVLS